MIKHIHTVGMQNKNFQKNQKKYLRIKTNNYFCTPKQERWESGLIHQFAKLTYGKPYRGFESPSLRKKKPVSR